MDTISAVADGMTYDIMTAFLMIVSQCQISLKISRTVLSNVVFVLSQ